VAHRSFKRTSASNLFAVALCLSCSSLLAQFPAVTVEFAPGTKGVVTVPVRNGLDMPVSVNGQPPIDVLLDTGSGSLMSSNLARRLGLKLEGNAVVAGAGAGTIQARTARVENLAIGGLTLHDVTFAVLDAPIAGGDEFAVLGDELVQHAVVTVDYVGRQVIFTDPAGFHYAGKCKPIPVRVEGNGLLAQGEVDGIPGMFGIDTGDVWSLVLLSPFVKQHDLIRHYGAKFKGYGGSGFGGSDVAYYTRVHTLRLGDTEVHEPITFLYIDTEGGTNHSSYLRNGSGNIGTHILRQFTVTFDVPHGALYLDPNENYGMPDIFNRAGLVLNGDHDALVVKTVLPGSAGAAAGIVEGDKILAVDGKLMTQPTDVAAMSESVGLGAFTRPVGTLLRLKIRHNKSVRNLSLTLREVL